MKDAEQEESVVYGTRKRGTQIEIDVDIYCCLVGKLFRSSSRGFQCYRPDEETCGTVKFCVLCMGVLRLLLN